MPPPEDKYEILEEIGRGSFGVIRKVRRKTDGLVMCRKEISYLRMSQKEREQLHEEFQILAQLRHPNIVAYYEREHLKKNQLLHLYMEYCPNGDLGQFIKARQSKRNYVEEHLVWDILCQIVMALYRCHYAVDPPAVDLDAWNESLAAPKLPPKARMIIHRDLKPENVFLGVDYSVKLGDFGLSKMISEHDFASTYVGTPLYMSPEICAAEKYTLKADIWSLGCVIFELCAYKPPFDGVKTHLELAQKIKEGKVPPLPDKYSQDLKRVIHSCLNVNPIHRPDTSQLLNLPRVREMRWQREAKRIIKLRDKELRGCRSQLEHQHVTMRQEIEATVRREWEVKARLEIDRRLDVERENLTRRYQEEVQARITEATAQAQSDIEAAKAEVEVETKARIESELRKRLDSDTWAHLAEVCGNIGGGGFEEGTTPRPIEDEADSLDLSGLSVSNMTDKDENKAVSTPCKANREALGGELRTPLGRAQTVFGYGTPMDLDTVSPKPRAIANLSLSPRRNVVKPLRTYTGNIFCVISRQASGDGQQGSSDGVGEEGSARGRQTPVIESDSDDEMMIPSPTRHPIRSAKNPFTSRDRPVLQSQKSCPVQVARRESRSSSNTDVAAAKSAQPRLVSKIPSVAGLQQPDAPGNSSATKNNIRGRTLVELQQARAGGRLLASDKASPRRAVDAAKRRLGGSSSSGSGAETPAVWDPERDEMPSPFLARGRRRG